MSAIKKSVSFPEELYNAGVERQKELNYPTFSDYLQHLIRIDMQQTAAELETGQVLELRDQISQISATLNKMTARKPVKYTKTKPAQKITGIPRSPKHGVENS